MSVNTSAAGIVPSILPSNCWWFWGKCNFGQYKPMWNFQPCVQPGVLANKSGPNHSLALDYTQHCKQVNALYVRCSSIWLEVKNHIQVSKKKNFQEFSRRCHRRPSTPQSSMAFNFSMSTVQVLFVDFGIGFGKKCQISCFDSRGVTFAKKKERCMSWIFLTLSSSEEAEIDGLHWLWSTAYCGTRWTALKPRDSPSLLSSNRLRWWSTWRRSSWRRTWSIICLRRAEEVKK